LTDRQKIPISERWTLPHPKSKVSFHYFFLNQNDFLIPTINNHDLSC
jgi:hypothetical protein